MKTISYKSQELKDRLHVDNLLLSLTVKPNMQALTIPLNKEGLFVTNLIRYEGQGTPEDYLKELFDDEDLSFSVEFANDWQGHFASAETMQKGRIFLAGRGCTHLRRTCLYFFLTAQTCIYLRHLCVRGPGRQDEK